MMNARLNKALVALLAVSAGACGDAPVDVAQNDPDRLVTNPSFVVIEAGETRLVQAYLVNALGNPVAGDVDFEACDAAITVEADPEQTDLEPGSNFLITGNTLGTSCVNVSGSGEEATINVRIIPAELALSLEDTILSGAGATAGVTFLNASGTAATGFDLDEVSFTSLDTLIAVVDPVTGDVTARAPGTAEIVVTLDEGLGAARADTFAVVVVPGSFTGTVTPNSGPGGQRITAEWGAGQPEWDSNSTASIRFGFEDYPLYRLLGSDANTFISDIPMGVAAGTGTITFGGLGPNQIALSTTFNMTSMATNDEHEPNQTFATCTPITLPYDNVLFQDGTDTEDRFCLGTLLAATPATLTLDWDDEHGSHDMDLYVYQQTATGFSAIATCSVANSTHPEVTSGCTLPAGVPLFVRIDNYDADVHGVNGPTNYRLRITTP